jgi:RhtB (resistance to homoserine/threonine) family protein
MTGLMTYLPLLLSLAAVDLLAAVSPGPNFLVVAQAALRGPFRQAGAVVAGILTANVLWCLGVVSGLSALLDLAPWLYGALKLLGGAYLIYLGVCVWRARGGGRAAAPAAPLEQGLSAAYLRGLLTNLSNPKSVVYFGSVFALFMAPATPLWVQSVAIGIVLLNTVLWYGTVAATFSRARVQRTYAALERPIHRTTGAVMVGFGARLMIELAYE